MDHQEHTEVDRLAAELADHLAHPPSESDPDTWLWAGEADAMQQRLNEARARARGVVWVVLAGGPCDGQTVTVAYDTYARLTTAAVLDAMDADTGRLRAVYAVGPRGRAVTEAGTVRWVWLPDAAADTRPRPQPVGEPIRAN